MLLPLFPTRCSVHPNTPNLFSLSYCSPSITGALYPHISILVPNTTVPFHSIHCYLVPAVPRCCPTQSTQLFFCSPYDFWHSPFHTAPAWDPFPSRQWSPKQIFPQIAISPPTLHKVFKNRSRNHKYQKENK